MRGALPTPMTALRMPALRRVLCALAGAAIGLALPSAALAQNKVQTDDRAGVYASLSGFGAIENQDFEGYQASSGGGFNIKLGYQWNRWLAFDLGYEFAGFGLEPTFSDPNASSTSLLTHYFPINIKIFLLDFGDKPMLGKLHPLVEAGIGPMWAQVGDTQRFPDRRDLENRRGMVWQAGAGLEYDISERFRGFIEGRYVAGMGSVDEVRYGAVGVGILASF